MPKMSKNCRFLEFLYKYKSIRNRKPKLVKNDIIVFLLYDWIDRFPILDVYLPFWVEKLIFSPKIVDFWNLSLITIRRMK